MIHFIQIFSKGNDLHEMSILFSWKNLKKKSSVIIWLSCPENAKVFSGFILIAGLWIFILKGSLLPYLKGFTLDVQTDIPDQIEGLVG